MRIFVKVWTFLKESIKFCPNKGGVGSQLQFATSLQKSVAEKSVAEKKRRWKKRRWKNDVSKRRHFQKRHFETGQSVWMIQMVSNFDGKTSF